ncbi:hypothetical protein V7S43_013584 [Phytophthora oleae]|uniref:HNH nuclease domain-containing protein n=1 Tax=Phytophthora oleae TaxID=2107226 RepID=A0ABD3F4S3_9STRA
MITLCCLIVGVAGSAFPVDIDENKLVEHVKEKINKEKMYQFPADMLQLFLAKKGGAWLKSNDPDVVCRRSRSIPDKAKQVDGLLHKDIDETERIDDLFRDAPTKKPGGPNQREVTLYTRRNYVHVDRIHVHERVQYNGFKNLQLEGEIGESTMLLCMVLDISLPSSVVVASHIFRRKHDRLKDFFVKIENIDDVRNGLLLFKPIKSALDDHGIAILVDKKDQFTLLILNPTIKAELLVKRLTQQQGGALGCDSLPAN